MFVFNGSSTNKSLSDYLFKIYLKSVKIKHCPVFWLRNSWIICMTKTVLVFTKLNIVRLKVSNSFLPT